MLQRLADEQCRFWNTGNPLLAYLRDRVFRTLDRNARLRYRAYSRPLPGAASSAVLTVDRIMAASCCPIHMRIGNHRSRHRRRRSS